MHSVLLASLLLALLARTASQPLPAEQWRALLPNSTASLLSPDSPFLSSPGGGTVYVAYTARAKPRLTWDDLVPAVAAFDTASGRLRWSFRFSFSFEGWARDAHNAVNSLTLAANGTILIVFSEMDQTSCLAALNVTSGEPTFPPRWLGAPNVISVLRPFTHSLPALTAAGNLVFINVTSVNGLGDIATIPIIDVRTGAARAAAVLPTSSVRAAGLDATRTRIVVYTDIFYPTSARALSAYSAVTGARQWVYTIPQSLSYSSLEALAMRAGSLYALGFCMEAFSLACPASGPVVLSLSLADGSLQRAVPVPSLSRRAEGLYSVPAGLLVTFLTRSQTWGLALLDATSLEQQWQWEQSSPALSGIAPLIAADGASVAVAATCYTGSAARACRGTSASVVSLASGAETPVQFGTQYARPVALPPAGRPGTVWAVGSAYPPTGGLARSAGADVVWQTRTDGSLVYLGAAAVNSSASLVYMLDTAASALVAASVPEAGPAAGAASSTSAPLSAGAQAGIALAAVAACGAALAAALHLRRLRARLFFRELPEGAAKGSDAALSAAN